MSSMGSKMQSKSENQGKFIILRKMKYSEADLILHALSVTGAKVSFIARSALKSKKRFGGGVLEPSHFVLLTYKDGKEGQLKVLTEAQIIDEFRGLRNTYESLDLALHVLDCIAKISQEGDVHSDSLFNLTGNMLKAISTSQNLNLLKVHFHLKLLYQQGVLTAEPWMTPFLKAKLSEHEALKEFTSLANQHSGMLALSVKEYVQRAETDFFAPNG